MNPLAPTDDGVAAVVRRVMDEKGVTQLGLSEATFIPRATLIRRLQGRSPFTVTELAAIAAVLDVELADLLRDAA